MHAQPFRDVFGVIERALRCVFRGQHHATHVLGPQGIHGDRRDNRGIDAAGQTQQHLFEAGFAHIVAQGFDTDAIVLLFARREHSLLALFAAPAIPVAAQIHMGGDLVKDRQLHGQMPAGIEHKRAAVKDLIVLTADHIHIDQRHAGLDHAGHHMAHAAVEFIAVIGRAIGHNEEFRAGFFKGFGHIREPGVLADRAADAGVADRIGAAEWA